PHLRGLLARRPEHRTLRGSIPAPAEPILVDLRFPCNKYPFAFSRKDLSTVCTVAEPTPPLSRNTCGRRHRLCRPYGTDTDAVFGPAGGRVRRPRTAGPREPGGRPPVGCRPPVPACVVREP